MESNGGYKREGHVLLTTQYVYVLQQHYLFIMQPPQTQPIPLKLKPPLLRPSLVSMTHAS